MLVRDEIILGRVSEELVATAKESVVPGSLRNTAALDSVKGKKYLE
jgi:hypothetical protein